MKYVIFGAGFVGKVTKRILTEHDPYAEIEFCDTNPELGFSAIPKSWDGVDGVFICVPTEYTDGGLDMDGVIGIMDKTPFYIPMYIRSTLPFSSIYLFDKYGDFYYIPEFLPEQDYSDILPIPDLTIMAKVGLAEDTDSVSKVFDAFISRSNNWVECSFKEAILIKLSLNAYLATRITFFNELASIANHIGAAPSVVINTISRSRRVGNYYNIPNDFYDGKCLPKDVREYSNHSQLATAVDKINNGFKENYLK